MEAVTSVSGVNTNDYDPFLKSTKNLSSLNIAFAHNDVLKASITSIKSVISYLSLIQEAGRQLSFLMASSSHRRTYDVFVSFRGEDIRKNFMDHLFSDFKRKGIHAFRDDEQLNRGEEISPGLYRAIKESRFLIVIFSNNYASSTWCLRELVKILECKEMAKDDYEVRTIFYDVKPSIVRNQTGSYADAFSKHEASKKIEVSRLKDALVRAADLSGWDLHDMTNGGSKKEFVAELLDACNLYSDTNIRVLIDRFLISISSGRLQMHDLLQEMGPAVVREESEEPGERSRLWFPEDVFEVLSKDMGTKTVKRLVLELSSSEVHFGNETFAQMKNLQLLNLYFKKSQRDVNIIKQKQMMRERSIGGPYETLNFLSDELRFFSWHGYPFYYLPKSFYPKSLVALDMSYSNIKQLWIGPQGFSNLTRLKLRHCHNLTETPDFSEIPNLRKLILEGCTNLVEVHPSVGLLKNLVILNLKDCRNLRSSPSIVGLISLQILILSGCSQVNELLKEPEKVKSSRVELSSLSSLRLLRKLDVSRCNLSGAHLDSISCLSMLEGLNRTLNNFATLPDSFGQLYRLKEVGLVGCKNLEALPELPPSITSIDAQDCTYLRKVSKPSIMYNSVSLNFNFSNCPKLVDPKTINSLASILMPQLRIEQDSQLNILLPGSDIPNWFSNQSMGDCIKIELPQNWCYEKFKGFATCAVLAPKTHPIDFKQRFQVGVEVQSLNDAYICGMVLNVHSFVVEDRCNIMDQIWLSYWAPNIKWRYLVKEYIEASFQSCRVNNEVIKCGIRLFYDEDEDEEERINSRMLPWLSSSSDDDFKIFYPNWNIKGT